MELKQSAVREKTTTESRGGDQSSVTKKYLFIKKHRKNFRCRDSGGDDRSTHTYSTYISLLILARRIALSVE
jgi:hypothetical protein